MDGIGTSKGRIRRCQTMGGTQAINTDVMTDEIVTTMQVTCN